MTRLTEDERLMKAIWRYEVIAPLIKGALPKGAQSALLKQLAGQFHVNEKNEMIRLGERTLERYLARYRQGGLEGLKPKVRSEKASLKAFGQQALDEAVALRLQKPELSADSIISLLQSQEVPDAQKMCVSTLNRHFRLLAKDRPSLKRAVRKRYHLLTVEGMHQLWICDVWDGPLMLDPILGKKRRLRLVATIDSHTRYIVHAEFYFNENLPALEDALLKAILKHGIPERYYVDNAKIFHSKHLKRIAAELGFRLHHSQPYKPQGRGKVERWFRTVAEKFGPLLLYALEKGEVKELNEVNQFFLSWVENQYHRRRHGSLKKSPLQAVEEAQIAGLVLSRTVEPDTIREAFLWREHRQVTNLATIKIYGNLYEVNESLMGKKVELRYNPYDLSRILIYDEGAFCCQAKPYQMKMFTDKRVQERQNSSADALKGAMKAIVEEHAKQAREKAGLSFARAFEVKQND